MTTEPEPMYTPEVLDALPDDELTRHFMRLQPNDCTPGYGIKVMFRVLKVVVRFLWEEFR